MSLKKKDLTKEKAKRRQYPAENLKAAVEKVKKMEMTRYEASKAFNVPLTTIKDRLNGRYGEKSGAKTLLSVQEEEALVNWVEEWAMVGQPLTKQRILNAAMKISFNHERRKFSDTGEFF